MHTVIVSCGIKIIISQGSTAVFITGEQIIDILPENIIGGLSQVYSIDK